MISEMLTQSVPWGDRTQLLPRKMLYALSLDVTAVADGPYLKVLASKEPGLRHMFDEAVVAMPEGLRCDVPTGTIDGGDGEIGVPTDPLAVDLQMRINLTLGSAGLLQINCLGVVNFNGGPTAFRSPATKPLAGSAFVGTTHEASSATYRWLNRRQLYGIGRVLGEPTGHSGRRRLTFSFDLYAAI